MAVMGITQGLQSAYSMYEGHKADVKGSNAYNHAMDAYRAEQQKYLKELEGMISEMPVESMTSADIEKIVQSMKNDYMDIYAKSTKPTIDTNFQKRGMYGSEIQGKKEGQALQEVGNQVGKTRVQLELEKKYQDQALKANKLQAQMGLVGQKAGLSSNLSQIQMQRAQELSQAGGGLMGAGLQGMINLPQQLMTMQYMQSLSGKTGAVGTSTNKYLTNPPANLDIFRNVRRGGAY